MKHKLSENTGKLINSVNQSMMSKNKAISLEENDSILSEEALIILEEVDKLKRAIQSLRREIKNVVSEQLEEMNATLITEGKGDDLHIMLGGHHFKGTVKHIKK